MRKISKNFIEKEINNTGFDKSYSLIGANKHKFLSFKLFNLKSVEANILKQCAISADCDCAIHRHCIDCKVPKTNAVLSGTISQLVELSKKIKKQPFSLKRISTQILDQIVISKKTSQTKIMGILNLTKDSFSDGNEFYDFEDAIKQADMLIAQGAQIIDIGAESTRPNADEIEPEIEIEKIIPVLNYIKDKYPNILVSIDTRHSKTAKETLEHKADIINDVSGLTFDKDMAKTVAKYDCKVVIMHSRGTPKTMENLCHYENVVDEVYQELSHMCDNAINEGIKKENIIIDIGFGFAKNYEQNIELMQRIEEFKSLDCPILAGVSRKSFLQTIANVKSAKESDEMTAHTSAYFASIGIDYIRVHNVEKTLSAVNFGKIFTPQKI